MSVSLSLNGRIFGADHSLARKQPFHLYDEKNRFLMLAKTNGEGAFKVTLPAPSDADEKMKLIFRLCTEDKWIKSHPALSGDPRLAENLSFLRGKQEVAELEETVLVKPEEQELGDLHLSVPIESEKVPLKYLLDLAAASIPANLSAAIAKTKERFDVFNLHGVDDVLEAFSPVKSELTPENTWKLITNGICPLYLKNEDPFLIAEVNWDRYEFDQLESLPNIKMVFKKKGDHLPEFERLEVTFRKTLEPSSLESNKTPKRIFKPDSDDLKTGLRIANSVFHVYGQTVFHLGMGHVYGMQVAVAVFDFLQGHKLGDLLLPHCHYIRKISNELGKTAIFGEEGILNKSALSVKGIAHLISDTLASLDPFSFEPRGPLGSWHKFARAQQFHFGLLKDGVKKYFDQHWDEMVEDWGPVHQYFRSLFKRSPQYRSWNGEELNPDKWQDLREIGGLGPQLPEREKLNPGDETVKSMRWIAKNPEGPGKHDREMIEHFVVDFIHRVTLWHSWIHRTQYASSKDFPAVSDPNFAPVVLHSFGDAPFGGITEQEAIEQLSIGATFGGFKVENYTLLKDGNGVVEEIASRVAQASGKYLKLGIDAKKEIMFGTVI